MFCLVEPLVLLTDELLGTPGCQLEITLDDSEWSSQFMAGYAQEGTHALPGFASCQFIGSCLSALMQELFAFKHQGHEPGNGSDQILFLYLAGLRAVSTLQ
jgi:hypothetical protein